MTLKQEIEILEMALKENNEDTLRELAMQYGHFNESMSVRAKVFVILAELKS